MPVKLLELLYWFIMISLVWTIWDDMHRCILDARWLLASGRHPPIQVVQAYHLESEAH